MVIVHSSAGYSRDERYGYGGGGVCKGGIRWGGVKHFFISQRHRKLEAIFIDPELYSDIEIYEFSFHKSMLQDIKIKKHCDWMLSNRWIRWARLTDKR